MTSVNNLTQPVEANQLQLREGKLMLNGTEIVCRSTDGKVNATQLCQAGNRLFKTWHRSEKTRAFLEALSASVLQSIDDLVTYETGSNKNRATWVHPQVAINIAQWISPIFCVRVTEWLWMFHREKRINIVETFRESLENETLDLDTSGFIYALTSNVLCDGIYKIGKTKYDVNFLTSKRYKTPYGDKIEVLIHKPVKNRHQAEDIIKEKLCIHAINESCELVKCDLETIQKAFASL